MIVIQIFMTHTPSQSPAEKTRDELLDTIVKLLSSDSLDATGVQAVLGKTTLWNVKKFLDQFTGNDSELRKKLIQLRNALNEESQKKPQIEWTTENATKVAEILDGCKIPDWIDSSLFDEVKLAGAFKTHKEMTNQALKNDTTFLFKNGRLIINLQGCPWLIFDSQWIVNNNTPRKTNWRKNGIQKLRAKNIKGDIDFWDQYYFNRVGGEVYIAERGERLKLKLADEDKIKNIAKEYGKDLPSLLGIDFTSWCRPDGVLFDDDLGGHTDLRLSAGRCLEVDAQFAWVIDDYGVYGFSLLFQDTSDT